MPSAVEITTMADEAHSSIQRLAAEVMVKPNHAIDPAVEAWQLEKQGGDTGFTEHAEYLVELATALLPPLYPVEGRH
jgi:hypothetical protein